MRSPVWTACAAFVFATHALAAPHSPRTPAGVHVPLIRRAPPAKSWEDQLEWARAQKPNTEAKYGAPTQNRKRSSGTNLMVNQDQDSSFYGTIAVGTPATTFNVILDTGSSDLWLADTHCGPLDGCTSIPVFNASASSTFRNLSTPFQVTYGSGKAIGSLGADTIEMAGFSITDQTFALVDQTIGGLLEAPVSGLLGLAWQTIASSGAVPFWQNLASNGAWDAPVMAFQLTRFLNASHPQDLEPGGSFTMGFTNDSLYTGDIEYTSIPGGQGTYWILPMTKLAVNGKSVSLLSSSAAYAAIDTGTTLVGGPSDQIEQVYAQIPGAQALTGTMSGYYTFPCATPVTVSVAFGGATTWDISPADFALPFQDPTGKRCLGAFFALDTGGAAPAWIVGDTFLKNVYSVFRYNPPSVGFARLAPAPLSALEVGPVPSPTLGVVATQISAASSSNTASSRAPISLWTLLAVGAGALASAWVC